MATFAQAKPIYVLDCGGQYCHLIASRIRQHEALSVVAPCETSAAELASKASAVIVSGGPQSVFEASSPRVDPAVWSLDMPLLGICYGCQMLCRDLGGEVVASDVGEYGPAALELVDDDDDETSSSSSSSVVVASEVVWMSHKDVVSTLPKGMKTIAKTKNSPHAAVRVVGKPIFGVQFHPEVRHTRRGDEMIGNFVTLAGVRGTWKATDFVKAQIDAIRHKVLGDDDENDDENDDDGSSKKKKKSVFTLVSGGVDSTVAFALIAKALPKDRVRGLYVDTGMMRLNETETVKSSLEKAGLGADNLHFVDASSRFLEALEGATAPEVKRKIIGREFVNVQKDECAKLMQHDVQWLLGQGTIYPDTIESGGEKKKADVIKTHHNRVPEIDELLEKGLVLEPLADLYKDEVRAVGEQLGLPKAMVWRQPFPGPGLGVRLLCVGDDLDQKKETVDFDALRDEATKLVPEGFLVDVPPLKSVGCQGDARTYRHFAVFDNYPHDWDLVADAATRLVNAHDDINRVVLSLGGRKKRGTKNGHHPPEQQQPPRYTVTPGAPHTVTKRRLDLLRRADDLATAHLEEGGFMKDIWQCPVAMAPLTLDPTANKEVIVLRPVESTEAMTASFFRLPFDTLADLADKLLANLHDDIADVFFDVTNKPPGTIEWE